MAWCFDSTDITSGEWASVQTGTARHFVRSATDCSFIASDSDIRDAFLRVTGSNGFEYFFPVRDLIPHVHTGYFTLYND